MSKIPLESSMCQFMLTNINYILHKQLLKLTSLSSKNVWPQVGKKFEYSDFENSLNIQILKFLISLFSMCVMT